MGQRQRALAMLILAATLAACGRSGDGPVAVAAAGGADGSAEFDQYCISCHGPDARGLENLGVDLVASRFVAQSSQEALVAFLKTGRLPDEPQSITGRPMPGFAWVPASELETIAAFLKSASEAH